MQSTFACSHKYEMNAIYLIASVQLVTITRILLDSVGLLLRDSFTPL